MEFGLSRERVHMLGRNSQCGKKKIIRNNGFSSSKSGFKVKSDNLNNRQPCTVSNFTRFIFKKCLKSKNSLPYSIRDTQNDCRKGLYGLEKPVFIYMKLASSQIQSERSESYEAKFSFELSKHFKNNVTLYTLNILNLTCVNFKLPIITSISVISVISVTFRRIKVILRDLKFNDSLNFINFTVICYSTTVNYTKIIKLIHNTILQSSFIILVNSNRNRNDNRNQDRNFKVVNVIVCITYEERNSNTKTNTNSNLFKILKSILTHIYTFSSRYQSWGNLRKAIARELMSMLKSIDQTSRNHLSCDQRNKEEIGRSDRPHHDEGENNIHLLDKSHYSDNPNN